MKKVNLKKNKYFRSTVLYRSTKLFRSTVLSISILLLLICTFIISSCGSPFGSPITPAVLELNKDEIPPVIVIDNPVNESGYASSVTVTGSIVDSQVVTGDNIGTLQSASYTILSTSTADVPITIGTNGAFTFDIADTTGYTGNIEIEITATDENGNVVSSVLKLVDDDIGPYITLSSPISLSSFESAVTVTGQVSNTQDTIGAITEIDSTSVRYKIVGQADSNAIVIGTDGSFSFDVTTSGIYDEEVVIQVLASDKNGDETVYQLRLLNDRTGPYMTITSPAFNSFYGASIIVQGKISNSSSTLGELSEVSSLSYQVLASSISGTVDITESSTEVDSEGNYSFQINATTLSDNQTIRVTAVDFNGNSTIESLTLYDAGNDIPDFSAVPGNGQVTLSWSEVPAADTYTVYYTTDDTTPSEYYSHDNIIAGLESLVEGTYTLTLDIYNGQPLENGSMHGFMLKASGDIGTGAETETINNFSEVIQAIPLSKSNLCPRVEGIAGGIKLSWNGIEGTDTYDIYRRISGEPEAINLVTNFNGTSFIDSYVTQGNSYSYSIAPSMTGAVLSSENEAKAVPIDVCTQESLIVDTRGWGYDVAIVGDYAVVADGASDTNEGILSVYDISNTNQISFEGGLQLDNSTPGLDEYANTHIKDIIVIGDLAYLAVVDYGLVVVDLSNPDTPLISGRCVIDSASYNIYGSQAVVVDGVYAYLAGSEYIYKIDVTSPETPLFDSASAMIDNYDFIDLSIEGDFVVAVTGGPYVRVFNKGDLSLVDTVDTSLLNLGPDLGGSSYDDYYASAVSCHEGNVYLGMRQSSPSDPGGVIIYGMNPSSGALSLVDITWGDNAPDDEMLELSTVCTDFFFKGDECYTVYGNTEGTSGVAAWDFSTPANPVYIMKQDIPGQPLSIFVSADRLVSSGNSGIKVFDYSNSISPATDSQTFPDEESLTSCYTRSGEYIYIMDLVGNMPDVYMLRVYSESDDGTVVLENSYDFEYFPGDMEISGDHLFMACGTDGLLVYSLSNSLSPVLLTEFETPRNGTQIEVRGSIVYLLEESSVQVIDIEVPDAPVTLKTLWLGSNPSDFLVEGDYLYVVLYGGDKKVSKYDISNPDDIKKLEDIDLSFEDGLDPKPGPEPVKLAAAGGYLYVSLSDSYSSWQSNPDDTLYSYQFVVIEISDSGNDEIVSFCTGSNDTYGSDIKVYGDFLFLIHGVASENYIGVYNISDKKNCFQMNAIAESGTQSLTVSGQYLYANTWAGPIRYDLLAE
ncbi:MAG: hypothetical protein JEY99_21450 [Spirochaetales bacterium]|nr:hypothetical protein [Spirochaetales bacterium]